MYVMKLAQRRAKIPKVHHHHLVTVKRRAVLYDDNLTLHKKNKSVPNSNIEAPFQC